MTRRLVLLAVIAVCAIVVPALAKPAMPAKITPKRVGPLELGMTYKELRATKLVARKQTGCELEGPGTAAARLKSPLGGVVELSKSKPRTAKSFIVTKGGTARGLVVGDKKADILDAYPKAKFDESLTETFGIILVRVPKNGGGKLQMALDAKTKKLTEFGIPYIRFCE